MSMLRAATEIFQGSVCEKSENILEKRGERGAFATAHQFFRMELHTYGRICIALYHLHHAVRRPSNNPKARSQILHGLMMQRVDHGIRDTRHLRKTGVRINAEIVIHIAVLNILYGKLARQILPQRAAASDIQKLTAPAYADYGQIAAAGGGKKTKIEIVTPDVHLAKPWTRLRTITGRLQILSTSHNQHIKPCDQGIELCIRAKARDNNRDVSPTRHCIGVIGVHHHIRGSVALRKTLGYADEQGFARTECHKRHEQQKHRRNQRAHCSSAINTNAAICTARLAGKIGVHHSVIPFPKPTTSLHLSPSQNKKPHFAVAQYPLDLKSKWRP